MDIYTLYSQSCKFNYSKQSRLYDQIISLYSISYLVTEDGVVTSKLSDCIFTSFIANVLVSQRINNFHSYKYETTNQHPDTLLNE